MLPLAGNLANQRRRSGQPLVSFRRVRRAEWRESDKEVLALEFGGDGTVDYIAFAPNARRPSLTQIRSGDKISYRDVITALEQGSITDWLWASNG